MKLTSSQFKKARDFIYANGRLLDRRRFEFHFEQGSAEAVLNALRPYQNEDGGYGSALEPDMRTPYSQPIATEYALSIMDEIGSWDLAMLNGIVNYLKNSLREEGGFPRATVDVNDYPHAPWWNTDKDHSGSINPTGRILGLLYKQEVLPGLEEENWFARSAQFVWKSIPHACKSDYHDLIQCITFLENVPDRKRAEQEWNRVDGWLQQPGTIELDPEAKGYVHKVLEWVPAPGSYAKKWISDKDIKRHLEYLIREQQEDGGWNMSFDALSPGNESEWRSLITVDRLVTLRSYGCLDSHGQ
ncbi:hypothetical protein MUG84_11890 [Paenibacillus sp. KQZ6P-2]|uniref:Squalene cyclase C-terminal domain-containing protein n=1 Tax=Paenibacillus mangrovi TaxID=2931978 RepID=A0A9X2B2E7_9BACL|nr:prenyltransferase/squalene oxidase repeat-containing protein [Paenibacillus mangrovi]MCJ8012434.1 hypothetical protein [Paenibacillus mangrovi]